MSVSSAGWYALRLGMVAIGLLLSGCQEESSQPSNATNDTKRESSMPSDNDPNAPGPDGHPAIFTAVERGDTRKVTELIAAGANIEARGYAQGTPLLIAAMGENWPMVELLLQAGAEPLAADEMGFTVPWVAATSRIRPETDDGQALNRVRQILNDRGVIGIVVQPRDVERLLAEGRWPPEPDTEAP